MVLPVAAATASMTWPISASLKLGVMRCPLLLPCLGADDAGRGERQHGRQQGRAEGCLPHYVQYQTVHMRGSCYSFPGAGSGGAWSGGIMPSPPSPSCSASLAICAMLSTSSCWRPLRVTVTRASVEEFSVREDLLRPVLVVERRAVDGGDQVAGAQSDAREGLAVGARIDAEAAHLAAGEHRLRAHDLADDARIVADQPAHALDRRRHRTADGHGGRGWRRRRGPGACGGAAARIRARHCDR